METGCALNHNVRPESWKALQQKLSGYRTNGGQQVTFGDRSKRLTSSVSARDEAMRVQNGPRFLFAACTTTIGTTVRCACLWPTQP